jgi:DNA-binding PadR family transcriptional regulator
MYGGVNLNIDKIRKRFIPMSETMFYILLSLQEERHGYGIMQYVKDLTKERIVLGAGTIYQSLGKLENDGLIIRVKEIDRKKIYAITDTGKQILLEEVHRIGEIYHNMEGLL